jgi:bifunctional non-homologous end joining protein LigD
MQTIGPPPGITAGMTMRAATSPTLDELIADGRPLGDGRVEVEVDGRRMRLSNLGKVLWPRTGTTKGALIDYVMRISPALLPHIRLRPLTLKRYPDGVEGVKFFEKRCPAHRPDWVLTEPVWSDRHGRMVDYCVVADLPTLIWLANLASIELHVDLHVAGAFETPTVLVFDLDPGPGTGIAECCRVALLLRSTLGGVGLESWAKTSGSKGLQVYVPLNDGRATFEQTKSFARTLAQLFEREASQLVVSRMTRSLRAGKVLIDWSQNDPYKSTICAYSTRARELPTVSAPVTWEEVAEASASGDGTALRFTMDDVLERVARCGDLFADVAAMVQRLPDPGAAPAGA